MVAITEPHARRASLTDKVKGEYMELVGRVTHNPGKAATGEALKTGRTDALHPTASAPASSASPSASAPAPGALSSTSSAPGASASAGPSTLSLSPSRILHKLRTSPAASPATSAAPTAPAVPAAPTSVAAATVPPEGMAGGPRAEPRCEALRGPGLDAACVDGVGLGAQDVPAVVGRGYVAGLEAGEGSLGR